MNITQTLVTQVKNRPNKVSIIDGTKSFTYQQFGQRVARLAGALEQAGVQKGDRVALLMLNEGRYLELLYGITLLGAIVVPLNVRLSPAESIFILRDSGAKALFIHKEFAPLLPKFRQEVPTVEQYVMCEDEVTQEGVIPYEELLAGAQPVALQGRAGENDVAGIFYTGGTTGMPKGVMLSHRNLLSNAYNVGLALNYAEDEVYLHASPMFHLADGASTFAITIVGGTHAHVRMFEPNQVLKTIQEAHVTSCLLVPTMITILINMPNLKDYDISSWRKVLYGASPCPPEVLKKAKQLLPIQFFQGYGQSEAAPVLTFLMAKDHVTEGDEHLVARLASCGQPLAGVEVRCFNANDEDVGPGEVGEIVARGPNVMLGYWNRPEETAAALAGGWLRTGDLATVDDENFFFLVDRKKDMIVTGGENVYSVEVENVVYTHPAILEAAVVGVPDERWGEAVKVIVVLKKDATLEEEELIEHCRRFLANYKVPKSVDIVSELPKSGAGKILKRNLRDRYWEGKSRRVN
ncbi:MAG: long-chain-fatty-acid--CoA ligase [Clostridia bacterium]